MVMKIIGMVNYTFNDMQIGTILSFYIEFIDGTSKTLVHGMLVIKINILIHLYNTNDPNHDKYILWQKIYQKYTSKKEL